MTQYTHRMTLVVSESLMSQANQLALIAGESPDDVNTFTTANYQDSEGNLYAVCSTVIKPIVLSLLNTPLSAAMLQSDAADITQAQQAMDAAVMYQPGALAAPGGILIAIDYDPAAFFTDCGLTLIDDGSAAL